MDEVAWRTAPGVTCPEPRCMGEGTYEGVGDVGSAFKCPKCGAELECVRSETVVQWAWRKKRC